MCCIHVVQSNCRVADAISTPGAAAGKCSCVEWMGMQRSFAACPPTSSGQLQLLAPQFPGSTPSGYCNSPLSRAAVQARAPQDEGQLCIAHSGVKVSAGGPPTKHPTGVLPDGCAAQGLRCSPDSEEPNLTPSDPTGELPDGCPAQGLRCPLRECDRCNPDLPNPCFQGLGSLLLF